MRPALHAACVGSTASRTQTPRLLCACYACRKRTGSRCLTAEQPAVAQLTSLASKFTGPAAAEPHKLLDNKSLSKRLAGLHVAAITPIEQEAVCLSGGICFAPKALCAYSNWGRTYVSD